MIRSVKQKFACAVRLFAHCLFRVVRPIRESVISLFLSIVTQEESFFFLELDTVSYICKAESGSIRRIKREARYRLTYSAQLSFKGRFLAVAGAVA